MSLKFTHLAEPIVTEIANSKRMEFLDALGLAAIADLDFVASLKQFAFEECSLESHGGYLFDGASRVDVVLWIKPELAVACELKLGTARLTARRFETEFLVDCRESHGGKRLAGNMMSILDRRFGDLAPKDGLSVWLDDACIPLARQWHLILQPSVISKWRNGESPAFSAQTNCVSIKNVVDTYGDSVDFNKLVKKQIDFDYYKSWIN